MLYGRREKLGFVKKLEKFVAKIFASLPLSPNFYTFSSIFFAFLTLVLMHFHEILFATITCFLAFALDFIDGAVARAKKLAGKKGAYLDTLVDRWVEIIVLAGFLFLELPEFLLPSYFWVYFLLAGSLMTTYTKAAAKEKELIKKELKGGLLERGERTAGIFAALILAGIKPFFSSVSLCILSLLSIATAVQRAIKAFKA